MKYEKLINEVIKNLDPNKDSQIICNNMRMILGESTKFFKKEPSEQLKEFPNKEILDIWYEAESNLKKK